jgi:micrococcal nuclease
VVDGDTFWFEGERVRIADIDAPEISRPECSREAELGRRSTQRLQALLNEGPFELRRQGSRDRDVYGRLLRTVHRDGRSLGDVLVDEGLARPWRGRSEQWCG